MNRNTRRRQVRARQRRIEIPHWTELLQTDLVELERMARDMDLAVEPGKMAHARALDEQRKRLQEAD